MFVCSSARSYIRSFFSSLVAIPCSINDIRLMANDFFHTLKVLRGRYSLTEHQIRSVKLCKSYLNNPI